MYFINLGWGWGWVRVACPRHRKQLQFVLYWERAHPSVWNIHT